MVKVNEADGYITVNYSKFLQLSPPVGRKLLEIVSKFVNSNAQGISSASSLNIYNSVVKKVRNDVPVNAYGSYSGCVVFHHDHKSFGVARTFLSNESQMFVKINVGQTVHWDNRFDISLNHLGGVAGGERMNETYFIRNMTREDYHLASKGIRKVKATRLPNVYCRSGLPVIVARKEGVDKRAWPVVLIPHFRVIERQYGVKCTCSYRPVRRLGTFLDYIPVDKTKT